MSITVFANVVDRSNGKVVGVVEVEILKGGDIKILSDSVYPGPDSNSAVCLLARKIGKKGKGHIAYEFGFCGGVTPDVLLFSPDGLAFAIADGLSIIL